MKQSSANGEKQIRGVDHLFPYKLLVSD